MKRWLGHPAVIIVGIASLTAILMAGMVVLLLPSSGEIVRLAQWRTARVKTMSLDAELQYTGETDEKSGAIVTGHRNQSATLGLLAKTDRRNIKEPRNAADFTLAIGDGAPAEYQGRTIRIASAHYLRFSKLPERLGNLPLANLVDRWLSYSPDSIRAKIPLPVFGGQGTPTDEEKEAQTLDYLRSTPFFTVEDRLKNDRINGVITLHYKVKPEILFIKDFVIRSEQLRLDRELDDRERRLIDATFANIAADEGEVWIGRSDYFLYRLHLRFRYDDGTRRGTLTIAASLGDFDQPVTINPPAEQADDIDRVIASLLPGLIKKLPLAGAGTATTVIGTATGGLHVTAPGSTVEADRDSDHLPDTLEYFYQTDPNNPDTDGDGALDGDEVDAGMNPSGPGQLFDFNISGR